MDDSSNKKVEGLLRKHWDAPPPPTDALRAQIFAAIDASAPPVATTQSRQLRRTRAVGWRRIACGAVMTAALLVMWRMPRHTATSAATDVIASESLSTYLADDDDIDETALFDLTAAVAQN